jgi:hypothetical protein
MGALMLHNEKIYDELCEFASDVVRQVMQAGEAKYPNTSLKAIVDRDDHLQHMAAHAEHALTGDTSDDHIAHAITRGVLALYRRNHFPPPPASLPIDSMDDDVKREAADWLTFLLAKNPLALSDATMDELRAALTRLEPPLLTQERLMPVGPIAEARLTRENAYLRANEALARDRGEAPYAHAHAKSQKEGPHA